MPKRKIKQDPQEMSQVGKRIRAALTLLGLTYKQVQEESGIPAGTVQKYAYGIAYVSGQMLKYFCQKGINPCWILTGKGDMFLSQ